MSDGTTLDGKVKANFGSTSKNGNGNKDGSVGNGIIYIKQLQNPRLGSAPLEKTVDPKGGAEKDKENIEDEDNEHIYPAYLDMDRSKKNETPAIAALETVKVIKGNVTTSDSLGSGRSSNGQKFGSYSTNVSSNSSRDGVNLGSGNRDGNGANFGVKPINPVEQKRIKDDIKSRIEKIANLYKKIAENTGQNIENARTYTEIFDLQTEIIKKLRGGEGTKEYFNALGTSDIFSGEISDGRIKAEDVQWLRGILGEDIEALRETNELKFESKIFNGITQLAIGWAEHDYDNEVKGKNDVEPKARSFNEAYSTNIKLAEESIERALIGKMNGGKEKVDANYFEDNNGLCEVLREAERSRFTTEMNVGKKSEEKIHPAKAAMGVAYDKISPEYKKSVEKYSNSIHFQHFDDATDSNGNRKWTFKKNDKTFTMSFTPDVAKKIDILEMNKYIGKDVGFFPGFVQYIKNNKSDLGIELEDLADIIQLPADNSPENKLKFIMDNLGIENANGSPRDDLRVGEDDRKLLENIFLKKDLSADKGVHTSKLREQETNKRECGPNCYPF
ncbi:MAG: hypothetical protein LBP39_00550 [Rickettsiales bacterium]|jgi:hypothetical protein|nr:hypothetical protein [Rickettsiales bacterium]